LKLNATPTSSIKDLENEARRRIAMLSLGLFQENTEMLIENQELRQKAMFDRLTGLKNRRAYDEQANAELERAMRTKRPFVMMIADIDHFKNCNDKYGHAVGDIVLKFVVILPECEIEYAISAAERLREAVETTPVEFDGRELKVTVSIGVAWCCYPKYMSIDELFEQADQLLYRAKRDGRNRCVFPVDITPATLRQLTQSGGSDSSLINPTVSLTD
jgi:PleD family two-component response regulator